MDREQSAKRNADQQRGGYQENQPNLEPDSFGQTFK